MTNAEKLAKEMLENLDDFAEILFSGICHLHMCDDCPLCNARLCCDKKKIEKWLEQEVEENVEIH